MLDREREGSGVRASGTLGAGTGGGLAAAIAQLGGTVREGGPVHGVARCAARPWEQHVLGRNGRVIATVIREDDEGTRVVVHRAPRTLSVRAG